MSRHQFGNIGGEGTVETIEMRRMWIASMVLLVVLVACGNPQESASPNEDTEPNETTAPEGRSAPTEIECSPGESAVASSIDYFAEPTGEKGDPEDIARRTVNGIEGGDEVLTVGGPQEDAREIGVVRDGKMIAKLSYMLAQNGGWYLDGYTACESSGITA
ncbi:MAG TPA: hypothetical protein VFA00_06375 [Actinomycetota bacterium]|nr:hypothetical protein [Actinomycetota bacterium]